MMRSDLRRGKTVPEPSPGSGLGFCEILCERQLAIYLHRWSVNSMNKLYHLGGLLRAEPWKLP